MHTTVDFKTSLPLYSALRIQAALNILLDVAIEYTGLDVLSRLYCPCSFLECVVECCTVLQTWMIAPYPVLLLGV